jgi:hypothetical protein
VVPNEQNVLELTCLTRRQFFRSQTTQKPISRNTFSNSVLQNTGIDGIDIEAYINIDESLQTTGELTLQELAETATNQIAERQAIPHKSTNEIA